MLAIICDLIGPVNPFERICYMNKNASKGYIYGTVHIIIYTFKKLKDAVIR